MIFFCEDCGARNSLTPRHIDKERVTFECITCQYLNSYPLPKTALKKKTIDMVTGAGHAKENSAASYDDYHRALHSILCKIEALPEIKNAFFFDPENSMFICSFPRRSPKITKLKNLCRLLYSHYSTAVESLPASVKELSLSRSNSLFFYGKLTDSLFLGIITTSGDTPFPFDRLLKKTTARLTSHFHSRKK